MTINEMIVELTKLKATGQGDLNVHIHRYGDGWCMPAIQVKAYPCHIVIGAANPAILWPNNEQDAVCKPEDALAN